MTHANIARLDRYRLVSGKFSGVKTKGVSSVWFYPEHCYFSNSVIKDAQYI